MNTLGHPYIAWKVLTTCDGWAVAGSWLPDLVPFVPDSVFGFGEIHEGGEKLLRFLDQQAPEKRGLALGMLTHGVSYGADQFSGDIEMRFEAQREDLAQKIIAATGVSCEAARGGRFHNYLWWGVDVQILRHKMDFTKRLSEVVPKIDISGISTLLAECFGKDEAEVERMVSWLFRPLVPENLITVGGLVRGWRHIASGLPERDQVDLEKTTALFEYCADLLEESWEAILDQVVEEVGANMRRFERGPR